MNESTMLLLNRALYILVRRLGGPAEFSREELKSVNTSGHAITLNVEDPSEMLIVKAIKLPEAKKYTKNKRAELH